MIMRHRLFAFLILCFDIGYALLVQQNQPCNKDRDILLSEDPSGNPQSFLRCTGVGVGTIGFWERRFCPHDMTFDFIKQQCRSPQQQQIQNNNMLGEEQEVKNIAILNGTCAHGEQCIGGTVCDLETLRCLCPYGTIANLETLSCHQLSSGLHNSYEKEIPSAKIVPSPNSGATPSYFKPLGPIIGELKNLAQSVSSSMNFNTFTQPPSVPTFSSYGGSNNNYNNYNGHNNNNMGGSGGSGFNINPQIASKPSVFLPEAQPIHPINSLVPPGGSCALGEHCGGGSVCTKPMNLCLCPGELEDHGGRCIVPPRNELPQPIMKVGIGAMCNRYAACDHDSTCINGRCQCVEPLIEHNGKCVLKLMPKEVGPGELCDNGEVCIKGSICDPTIPVCVCPSGTDLENGECVEVKPTSSYETIPTQPVFRPDPQTIAQEIYGNSNYNNYGAPPTPPVRGAQVITYAPQPQPAPTQAPPVAYTSAPERSPKPNVMKMNLGGTKQAGVGVRCSLNTDCMIGAYCNGNTQPPTCQCLSTHVNVNGRCEKVIYPGQVGCEHDQQCMAAYTGTSCIDRQCVCPAGSKAIEQTCVSADEKLRSPPGGSCSEVEECSGGSVCREGWCVCPDPTMIVMRGICVQTQPRPTVPPQTTKTPPQHVPQGAYNSLQNLRPVNQGYETMTTRPSGGSGAMLPAPRKAAPGTNCGPLDICVGGSSCVDNYCICPSGHTASVDTGRCEPNQEPQSRPAQEPRTEVRTDQDKKNDNAWFTHIPTYSSKINPSAVRPSINNALHLRPPPITTLIPRPIVTVKAPPSSYVADGRPVSSAEYNHNTNTYNTYAPIGTTKGFHVINTESTEEKQYILPEPDVDSRNDCEKRGLICKGGTICVNLTCQCPQGHVLHNDQCVPPEKKKYTNKRRGKSWNRAPRYSRPNEPCSNGEICTGGSECREKQTCVCPVDRPIIREHNCIASDEKPMIRHVAGPGEECNKETRCTDRSVCYQGICRCQSGYIAISGKCIQLPTTQQTELPTTRLAIIVGPGENCGQDRSCGGGSSCENGVCTCPMGSMNMGGQCQKLVSTERAETTSATVAPFGKSHRRLAGIEHTCNDDTQCGANAICIVGKCKCRTGYKEANGVCTIMEDVAVAHNRTYSSISNSQQIHKSEAASKSGSNVKSTSNPNYAETETSSAPKPRIVGPPIRKPKPKTPSGPTPLVTGGGRTNGVGVCPPGNEPLRDESSGDLVLCNGLTPNCPPKSYCYVTGVASEEYNCCKSW